MADLYITNANPDNIAASFDVFGSIKKWFENVAKTKKEIAPDFTDNNPDNIAANIGLDKPAAEAAEKIKDFVNGTKDTAAAIKDDYYKNNPDNIAQFATDEQIGIYGNNTELLIAIGVFILGALIITKK